MAAGSGKLNFALRGNSMLKWYRYFRGYVIVLVSGEYTQFLNIAVQNRLSVWGHHLQNGGLLVCMSLSSFCKMRKLVRKRAFSLHITERCGFPFLFRRYRFRYGLAVGFAVYFLILYYLSGFIWVMNIHGTTDSENMEKLCAQLGISVGMKSEKLDADQAAHRLLIQSEQYGFAALNLEGSTLTVVVSETPPVTKKNGTVGNLVAAKDGIIRKFDLNAGTQAVTIGSAVKKGDLLVSGIVEYPSKTVYVAADGTVFATVRETYHVTVPQHLKTKVHEPIGRTQSSLLFFGVHFALPQFKKTNADRKVFTNHLHLFGVQMPIATVTEKNYKTETVETVLSNDAAQEYLRQKIDARIQNDRIEKYKTVDEKFSVNRNQFSMRRTVEYNTDIAVFSEIIVEPVN